LILKWNEFKSIQNTVKLPNEGISASSNQVSKEKLNLLKENEILLKMDLENVKSRWNTDKSLLANAENEIKELKTKLKQLEQQQWQQKQQNANEEKVEEVKEEIQLKNSIQDLEKLQNEHELSIQQYYENELVNLKYQLFLVDGKATYYYQEVEYLNENIKILMHQSSLEKQTSLGLKQNINDLNDELETTRQRYEDQIRTMTEHIALMNDRLTEQAEIIEKFNNPSKNLSKNKKAK
jgi:protein phosphatase 1 regulatory subunit 21